MSEHHGYLIKQNPDSGKWEVFWKDKKVAANFAIEADAEEWIEDQVPLYRTNWNDRLRRLFTTNSTRLRERAPYS